MRSATTRARTAVRAIAAAVALLIGAAMLTACGPVNAGTTAASEFERDFADVAGVAAIETGGHNNLPFSGRVEAQVTAVTGLSDAEVDELADAFSEYTRTHSANVSWDSTLIAGTITVGIDEDASIGADNLAVARGLLDELGETTKVAIRASYENYVLVVVDSPATMTAGYFAAARAVQSFGTIGGPSNAVATSPEGFSIDDEARDGAATTIGPALMAYEIAASQFVLSAAGITPDNVSLRTADEGDIDALKELLAGIPFPDDLTISVQGGRTTRKDPTAAADAVADALSSIPEAVTIGASDAYVNVTVNTPSDADQVFAAISTMPEFQALNGFGLRTTAGDFDVFDRPGDFADSLAVAQAAIALPGIERLDVRDSDADDQELAARFWFTSSSESTMSAFVTTMKPLMIERGWHTFVNADGRVIWFVADDQLVVEDSIGGRSREEQQFADILVRLWDAA